MKQKYYVNDHAQPNGDHEIHVTSCKYYDPIASKIYLGEFELCQEAVRVAKRRYSMANGCFTCCQPCHTR